MSKWAGFESGPGFSTVLLENVLVLKCSRNVSRARSSRRASERGRSGSDQGGCSPGAGCTGPAGWPRFGVRPAPSPTSCPALAEVLMSSEMRSVCCFSCSHRPRVVLLMGPCLFEGPASTSHPDLSPAPVHSDTPGRMLTRDWTLQGRRTHLGKGKSLPTRRFRGSFS